MTHEHLPTRSLSGGDADPSFVREDSNIGWAVLTFSQITIAQRELERLAKLPLIKSEEDARVKAAEYEKAVDLCEDAYKRDLHLAQTLKPDHLALAQAIQNIEESAGHDAYHYMLYVSTFTISGEVSTLCNFQDPSGH